MRRLLPIALFLTVLAGSATVSPGQTPKPARPALACPSHFRGPQFRNYPALNRKLVPAGPTRFLVCRYSGLNVRNPESLAGSGVVRRGPRLHRVVRLYNRLPKAPPGPIVCPADTGRELTVQFRYRRRPDDLVWQSLSGCRFATNGHRSAEIDHRGERLLRLLRRISA